MTLSLIEALEAYRQARTVLDTAPNYWGTESDREANKAAQAALQTAKQHLRASARQVERDTGVSPKTRQTNAGVALLGWVGPHGCLSAEVKEALQIAAII